MTVLLELSDERAEWLKELMRNQFCRFPQDEDAYDKENREELFKDLSKEIPD